MIITDVVTPHLASRSAIASSMSHLLVVSIDVDLEDPFNAPFEIVVRPTTLIRVLHKTIAEELRLTNLGENYQSSLEILPLKMVPTLQYLKSQDLAELRKDARRPDGLPEFPVAEFFAPKVSGGIHLLVWLPPKDGEFLWLGLSHN